VSPAAQERPGRAREYLLLAGFVLICAAAVATVLLPETQSEEPQRPATAAEATAGPQKSQAAGP
jgi:hypothetical protein